MSRPRIRTIKPELWQDEKIGWLSRDARLLFIGLITMADDEGRLRAIPSLIIGHVYPYDSVTPRNLAKWSQELEASGLLQRYDAGGVPYIQLSGWRKHQKINRPSPSELPAPGGKLTEDSVKTHGGGTDGSPLPYAPADRIGSGEDQEPPNPPQAGGDEPPKNSRAHGTNPRALAELEPTRLQHWKAWAQREVPDLPLTGAIQAAFAIEASAGADAVTPESVAARLAPPAAGTANHNQEAAA